VLLDRQWFVLNEKQFEMFEEVLNNPPPNNEKLKRAMKRTSPWEK
jgi:uncharacterized protein (DUF1778 family)